MEKHGGECWEAAPQSVWPCSHSLVSQNFTVWYCAASSATHSIERGTFPVLVLCRAEEPVLGSWAAAGRALLWELAARSCDTLVSSPVSSSQCNISLSHWAFCLTSADEVLLGIAKRCVLLTPKIHNLLRERWVSVGLLLQGDLCLLVAQEEQKGLGAYSQAVQVTTYLYYLGQNTRLIVNDIFTKSVVSIVVVVLCEMNICVLLFPAPVSCIIAFSCSAAHR